MKVRELIDRILDEAVRLGQRPHGAYRSYWDIYNPIITFFEGKGLDEYSPDVLKEYSDWVDAKFADGKIKRERHSMLKTAARRVAHYEATGTYLWNVPKRGTRYELDSYYTVLLDEFLASEDFNQNTKGDIEWAARRYFHWLLGQGIREIGKANQDIIQKYLHSCFDEMKPVSVYNVHPYMRKLYRFLKVMGYAGDDYEAFFSFKICRESRLYPAAGDEMVNAVLNVIDTQTATGKRGYAVILLGYVLGMRMVDIARLRLTEIGWARGEIRFAQHKTKKPVVLPLTTDVGEALKDYILNGRPNTGCEEVFLRAFPPFLPFKNPNCINTQFAVLQARRN